MGDGTLENPFTRKDVLDAIARNGGGALDLDLSGKQFKGAIDLRNKNLAGIILNNAILLHAKFDGSNLKGAKLRETNLQHAKFNKYEDSVAYLREADLSGALLNDAEFREADLEGAHFGDKKESDMVTPLFDTDFRDANLRFIDFIGCHFFRTKLEGAYIWGAKFCDSHLEDANWGNFKSGEERENNFSSAESVYRQLKMWYTNAGKYDIAGEFFFREMEAKRKQIKWRPNPRHRLWVEFVSFICGYGERPFRVIGWAALVILVLALIYFAASSAWGWGAFCSSLYFSAVSFTALGYGSWMELPDNLRGDFIRAIGAVESFIGVFTIALFLITFTRKMRR